MSTLPKISVVVPSYNQGHYLRDTLESIFCQDYPNVEVVVMDGGSKDDSVSIIREYAPRLHHWQSEKDGGQSAAINGGAAHCTGDLVTWLNSDDFYWKDSLWTVARAFLRYPQRGMYIGNCLRYEQETGEYSTYCDRHMAHSRYAMTHWTNTVPQPSTFFLRDAWQRVGGLRPELEYIMDWDVFIRIGQRYPVVVMNEFLAVAREYEDTKTRSGKIIRAFEMLQMIRQHTGKELTPGGLHYLLEAAHAAAPDEIRVEVDAELQKGRGVGCRWFARNHGGGYVTPTVSDEQDQVFHPIAGADSPQRVATGDPSKISIVIPSYNRCADLQKTIASVVNQRDPNVEIVVIDGESTDGTAAWLKQQVDASVLWESQTDDGPAGAINRGMAKANGAILAWLNPGDQLTAGSLYEIRNAFADDAVDAVHGNALFADENDQLRLLNRTGFDTAFWRSEWTVDAVKHSEEMKVCDRPQPTLFFRRRLWDQAGPLNESYRYVYDLDWRWRWRELAAVAKIERTQAIVRMRGEADAISANAFCDDLCAWMLDQWGPHTENHPDRFQYAYFVLFTEYCLQWPAATYERWNASLQHCYSTQRKRWPSMWSKAFRGIWKKYVNWYMVRKSPENDEGKLRRRWRKLRVALSALTGWGNPEQWRPDRLGAPDATEDLAQADAPVAPTARAA